MIRAQDKKFQKHFIISVLEVIMALKSCNM